MQVSISREIHKVSPESLHTTKHSWSFASWGVDNVGPFEKATDRVYKYILVVTDYFSKWAEPIAVRYFVSTTVTKFIRVHNTYRFVVPESITVDNGQPFKSAALYKLYKNTESERIIPCGTTHLLIDSQKRSIRPSALYLKKW